MRKLWPVLAAICAFAGAARAEGERAGDFDYYVMALSWSANWCALEGDARRDPQCDRGSGVPFVLHGLWPQFETGWPSYCRTGAADPSRGDTAAVADVFGGAGSAFYQWKKHGRCSGLSARDYYALARKAFGAVTVPPVFSRITKDMKLPASVVEDAFVESNPGLARDQITVTCRAGMIQEVRLCLTRDLQPRRCGADVIRDCSLQDAELNAVR
ncbi:ribonuclease T2 family protein [Pseudotabrizicola algicola]|uniref:Ribonuclease T2 n=1 Tax=Pseudotabrizicola algicola TaxID=2709381 RepID=A0A6B3RJ29_9RHOB|nr:ribonuclease T2 [Pseudotabrizicola algicola]NEX46047.1 ribonuclease T2 [Pseudotabrizicola algicola]